MLIVVGVFMWIAERASKGDKLLSKVGWGDAIVIGTAQALALVPGTSRSGITITTGLFRGFSRETAARFSFLLGTPAIAGAALKGAWDIHKAGGIAPDMRMPFPGGHAAERGVGRGSDRVLPALPAPQQPDAVHVLSNHFWHNSNRSGCVFPLPRGMKIIGPTRFARLNEAAGLVLLFAGLFFILSLISYHPRDPSWNSISGAARAHNLTGRAGSYTADLFFQLFGLSSFSIPVLMWLMAWKWVRSQPVEAALVKVMGAVLFFLSVSTALSIGPGWRLWNGAFSAGGVLGLLLADCLDCFAESDRDHTADGREPDRLDLSDIQVFDGDGGGVAGAGSGVAG